MKPKRKSWCNNEQWATSSPLEHEATQGKRRRANPEEEAERKQQKCDMRKYVFTHNSSYLRSSLSYQKNFFFATYCIFNIFNIIDVSCALRQKAGGACVYMPHNAYWPAGFEVTPPPKVDSPAAKII